MVMKAMENRQELIVPICSPKLGEPAYITTGCRFVAAVLL